MQASQERPKKIKVAGICSRRATLIFKKTAFEA